ncbi:hypothetical protein LXM25_27170 [Dyadobacter sp. LJ53]|uniref:hypothetical protein n=1 Tax=Dyadobacter chenwenxiniae TaxID=2906456 RepID=UPI001F3CEE44|nr:hypothetical protein [Dyadobacter chenwenxiniae]MCF0053784.1 hypothetical protein [Dyadobacter chenwenxiniae]
MTDPSFSAFLYLTPGHLATQTTDIVYAFHLQRRNSARVLAIFQCVEQPANVWISPPNAPFGGIQCAIGCTDSELTFFARCIIDWMKGRSGKKLVIKTAPFCYQPILHNLLHNVYINTGFAVIQCFANSFIPVDQNNFISRIKSAEKRKLKKAIAAGFQAAILPELPCATVYEFLAQCRDQKGYRMPLTLWQIENLRQKFPDTYRVFAVMDKAKIIALTLTVRVNNKILYNFLCDDLLSYRVYSPMVMLTEAVYNHCQQEHIEILDLGISLNENGDHKPSLSRFKKNISGEDCTKITYEINFPY